MSDQSTQFQDEKLRAVIRRSVGNSAPRPGLKMKIDSLFDAPPSIPLRAWYSHWSVKVSAVLLIAITLGLLIKQSGHHEEEEEYLVDEHALWPAMTRLHESPSVTKPDSIEAIARTIHYPVATLPSDVGQLISSSSGEFVGIPAAAVRYKIDGKEMTLITADARKILRETDEVEVYHEKVGTYQLAGGNRGDSWICILADHDVPQARLDELLKRAEITIDKK